MTRHASIADQLSALRAYLDRPLASEPIEPITTNWSAVPANDNTPPHDFNDERRVSMRPTIGEIMRSVQSGPTERNEAGQIVRIGKLRFSDGGQSERCTMHGLDGKTIIGTVKMPVGAMLGTSESQERVLGGTQSPQGSNLFFADVFKVEPRAYVPNGKRRKGRNYSRDEAAAILAAAMANTPSMPETTTCPDGLAMGTACVADNFIGMKIGSTSKGGAIAWQDLSSKIAEREAWEAVERDLSRDDKTALGVMPKAANMRHVGASVGFNGKHAERKGKGALLAANDNLMAAVRKYAS